MKKDSFYLINAFICIILGVIGVCLCGFGLTFREIFPNISHFVRIIISTISYFLGVLMFLIVMCFALAEDGFREAFENIKRLMIFLMTIPRMFKKRVKGIKMNKENYFWVPIKKLSEGQFSDERAIIIQLANGEDVSLFVHKDLISQCLHCGSHFVKTTLIQKTEKTIFVLLPDEAFETQTRHAEIKINDKLNFKTSF